MTIKSGLATTLFLMGTAAACTRTTSRYSKSELAGAYVCAATNEGLVLEDSGEFEHCWVASSNVASERGRWDIGGVGGKNTEVILTHGSTSVPRGEEVNVPGPWKEGLLVQEIDSRPGLVISPDEYGMYFVSDRHGASVCPRNYGTERIRPRSP